MNIITEQKVDKTSPNYNEDELFWHNFKIADSEHALSLFISIALGWFQKHPERSYQDLEKLLREKDFDTYLIAIKPNLFATGKLATLQEGDTYNPVYECIYSCRPKPNALKELLTHSKTYEENFEKLAISGRVIVEEISKLEQEKDVKMFNNEEQNVSDKLRNCEIKLGVKRIPATEYFSQLVDDYAEQYNKPIKTPIIAMNSKGGPICGIVIENMLVSPIGLSVYYDKDGQKVAEIVKIG